LAAAQARRGCYYSGGLPGARTCSGTVRILEEHIVSPRVTPQKDPQTITPDGQLIGPRIEGLGVHPRPLVADKRGEIIEAYNPAWGLHAEPLVYVYQVVLRPGAIKGWVVHRNQDDRVFTCSGAMRWVFFDNRPGSPTYRLINELVVGERNRTLVITPAGVFHAVQNIGPAEAVFINMPTRPYDHGDPDKYRLPIKNELIPFDFDDPRGW
jgi:dTDP-4-dehydrorhamnose 3,5-epimerase